MSDDAPTAGNALQPECGAAVIALPRKKKRLRWWVYALLAILVLMLGVGGTYSVWYWSAYSKLQAEITAARQRGEPVWFSELEPSPVAPEENGALLLLQAASKLQIDTTQLDAAMARATHYLYSGDDDGNQLANTLELEAALQANSRALELARNALRMPKFRFDTDYHAVSPASSDYGVDYFELLLLAESCVHMARERPNAAVNSIQDVLALAGCTRDEPFVYSHYVRGVTASLTMSHIGIIVGQTQLTFDEFARLDRELESLATTFQLRRVLLCERAAVMTKMASDDLQHSHTWWSQPLFLMDQAATFRLLTQWSELIDTPGRPFGSLQDRLDTLSRRVPGVRMRLADLEADVASCLRCRQSLIIARLGLRVDRHFRQHGRWPDDLAEVLDERMQELPRCHFSGLPLKWKTFGSSSGFVIYTPGERDGVPLDSPEYGSTFVVGYNEVAPQDDPLAPP